MKAPLLLTKFHMPAPRAEFVQRPRLQDQLSVLGKLTLICAPAGFGKTSLASCRLSQITGKVAWLSLDENDNDPDRFITYLAASLNRLDPSIGQFVLNAMQTPNPPAVITLFSYLINDLVQSNSRFILALDDYHLIRSEAGHEAVTFLLDHLPSQLHVIILSRSEPPLPIAKFRALGQLTELNEADLRFTRREAEQFLNQTMHLDLSGEQITQLKDQTEGWVTGLQLAALSLKGAPDAAAFIQRMSGSDRFIADYLVSEVVANQPEHIQHFLLQTSILGQMSVDLCNTILDIDNSQEILEILEKTNLFIIPLDNNRQWYRYHQLFADMLRDQLLRQDPDRVVVLQRRAAAWFMEAGMWNESIEHSLAAQDYEKVVKYLDSVIDEILAQGRFSTYLGWLDSIPEAYMTPSIALYLLFFLHEMGEFERAEKQIERVEEMLGPIPANSEDLNAETAVHFGILAAIKGIRFASAFDTVTASAYFRQSRQLLPMEQNFWRILAMGGFGFCQRVDGNYAGAITILSEVVGMAIQSNLVFITFMYSIALAKIYREIGKLQDAIFTCQRLLEFQDRQSSPITFAGLAYVTMGELFFHAGDHSLAEKWIEQGLDQVIRDGEAFTISDGYFTIAQIKVAQGDFEAANELMIELSETNSNLTKSRSVSIVVNAYRAYINITTGNLAGAENWNNQTGYSYLENKQFPDLTGLPYLGVYRTGQRQLDHFSNFIRLVQAKYAINSGQGQNALEIIDDLLGKVEPAQRVLFHAQVLIQKALAWQQIGDLTSAVGAMTEAINLIIPEPYYQIFTSEAEPMRRLLEAVRKTSDDENQASRFSAQLLARMPYNLNPVRERSAFDLTPRELEVLICLAQGLTYAQAADQLFISINTLRTYVKRTYRKLDADNRTQAIRKAQAVGLIPNIT